DFIQQIWVFDEFKPLRKGEFLGVFENRILAPLGVEHDLRIQELGLVILEPAHIDGCGRHEAVTKRGLARLDAVDCELHDVWLFGLEPEGRGDRMQWPHQDSEPAFAERAPQRIDFGQGNVRTMTGSISASTSSVARPFFSISAM